jgi:hypothetical protein
VRPYLLRRPKRRRHTTLRQSPMPASTERPRGRWIFVLFSILGCTGIGLVCAYLLLTDPAAEMIALQEQSAATATAIAEAASLPAKPVPTELADDVGNQQNVAANAPPVATAYVPQSQPRPSSLPTDVIKGSVQWTAADGQIVVQRNLVIPSGARLVIGPGSDIRFDAGVSILVEGQLRVIGRPNALVTMLPLSTASDQRWEGIFGNPGSLITIESADIQGAGLGGTMLASTGSVPNPSALIVRRTRFADNGGQVLAIDSRLDIRDSEISNNDQPAGAVINATYTVSNQFTLVNNRISDNRLANGVAGVTVTNTDTAAALVVQLQRNVIINSNDSPNLLLSIEAPIQGRVSCNTFQGGSLGIDIRGNARKIPALGLAIYNNNLDKHTPSSDWNAHNHGRGAESELDIRMYGNWWGDGSGPFQPFSNPSGNGDAVGEAIAYAGWLAGPPACAPTP